MIAAQKGHHEVVRLLADKGANLDLADNDGHTPLSVATQNGHDEVVGFLSTWRQYLRHQHCLIRLRVGATYATLPVGHEERVLYHFAYGQNKVGAPVPAEDEMLPSNLLPDDLWPLVVRCLVGGVNLQMAAATPKNLLSTCRRKSPKKCSACRRKWRLPSACRRKTGGGISGPPLHEPQHGCREPP